MSRVGVSGLYVKYMFNFVKHCFYYSSGLEKYIFHRMREGKGGRTREAERLEEGRIEREKGKKEEEKEKES